MMSTERLERHRMLHGILDQCIATYLAEAPPPPGSSRTSIHDSLARMIEHGQLLGHAVDELLQEYFRTGHSADDEIHDLMRWSFAQTLQRRVIARVRIGEKILRFRRGNYSDRRLIPIIERGPFGCFLASWCWGQIGWELARWT